MNLRKHMYLERKRADYRSVGRCKCKCGHVVYIPAKCKFIYCNWCGRKVWKNDKIKFEYLLKQKLEQVQKQKNSSR